MIVHPAYPGGRSTKAVSSQIDLACTLLALTGKPFDAVASASAGLPGRDLSGVLSAPEQAAANAVRPAALYNYNMFSYLDAKWFAPLIKVVVSSEPMVEKLERIVRLQAMSTKAGRRARPSPRPLGISNHCSASGRTKIVGGGFCRTTTSIASATATPTWFGCSKS